MPVLLLHPRGTDRILSLNIGPTEAFAISSVLNALESGGENSLNPPQKIFLPPGAPAGEEALAPRPMTHDLTLALMRALGGRMLEVELLCVVDRAFKARIVVATDAALLRVDCRPSDGVALALRCGAMIRAAEAVLAHAENAAEVISSLPEHVRLLARARMTLPGNQLEIQRKNDPHPALSPPRDFLPEPKFEKEDSAPQGSPPQKNQQFRIRAAPASRGKIADAASVLAALKQYGKDPGDAPPAIPAKQVGNIRISLVRQNHSGTLEIVDEFSLPSKNAAVSATPPDPLAEAEQILKNGGTEEERWAALLKILSPETKLPM
ncbi:MAG: bifunctional nuclease family protein [Desulfovibrio sp.]|nr:bifunctional nuclease family protein [Desulfovibrio sp.]